MTKKIIDYIKNRTDLVSNVLLGVCVFSAGVILLQLAGLLVTSVSAKNLVEKAVQQNKQEARDIEKYFAKSKETASGLKKNNLFAPVVQQNPIREVSGIFGEEALISGKWYKAGDMVSDAKIVAIEPTRIKVLWQGKETILEPMQSSGPASAPPPAQGPANAPAAPMPPAPATPVQAGVSPPQADDPLAWMGIQLSPPARTRMLEQWNKASDEQKEKIKEQWNKMSDEEKQKAVDSMEK